MSKEHVRIAQSQLVTAGLYTGLIDGDFGQGSLAAVEQLLLNAKSATDALAQTESAEPPRLANYILSENSLQELRGVDAQLVKVVKRAIQITEMDFRVFDGKRTTAEQRALVNKGSSQTMKSKHVDGRAVDLIPVINGRLNFEDWPNFYPIAHAMQTAANELGVKIQWGGCWAFINNKTGKSETWVADYVAARKAIGRSAFIDGPHFDLG